MREKEKGYSTEKWTIKYKYKERERTKRKKKKGRIIKGVRVKLSVDWGSEVIKNWERERQWQRERERERESEYNETEIGLKME